MYICNLSTQEITPEKEQMKQHKDTNKKGPVFITNDCTMMDAVWCVKMSHSIRESVF